ncbi:MAG: N-acyl homoserine lactonase family protein [Alphaproteobacteria bacterium]|jgi:glyoxylase-like metal-dependent hydrolase (beta-lactamase superfamily II)
MRLLAAFVMALCLTASAQTAAPPGLPPLPRLTSPRLYVLDCGTIISHEPERFGLRREDVSDPDFSDPCFLVMHPRGVLLFDTGLTDAQVGRPIYENKNGYEGLLKTTTLKGELANIGLTPAAITYLAISHSHWDHVGNGNAYAGSTWLARKAEYDVMFGPAANDAAKNNYAALAHAKIQYVEGDHDVFGDGSVVLLSTPGHTPGHQSLYVKLTNTGGVVVSGDLYHYPAERAQGKMPAREYASGTPQSRKKIEDFLTRTQSQLWIGHSIDWYRDAVKAPGWYN